jgi:hypothetical protein
LIIDTDGDIVLDAAGSDIRFKANGTEFGFHQINSSDYVISSSVQDKDLVFKGDDGGSPVTALTLDMSDAGTAVFGHDIYLYDNGEIQVGTGSDLRIYHDGSNSYISDTGSTGLIIKNDALILARGGNTEKYLEATANGAVDLYHNNNKKLETASTGIAVTGTLTGATNLVTQVASGSTDAMSTNDTFNIHTATVNSAYLVIANANDSLTNVIAFVAIGTSASTMRITNQGGSYNTTVTGSGANIQITNGYGSSLTYTYRVIQIQ